MKRLFGGRMRKIKAAGAEMESAGRNAVRIVFAVPQNRTACMGKLDTDLVMPSRVQMNGQTGNEPPVPGMLIQHLVVQDGLFGIGRIR